MFNVFLAAAVLAAAIGKPSGELATLRAADQALLDAIAPGDRGLWDRTLTSDAIYIDENGAVLDRASFLKALSPLPAGSTGKITIIAYDGVVHGDVALVRRRDDEREVYHGAQLHAEYLMTETSLRQRRRSPDEHSRRRSQPSSVGGNAGCAVPPRQPRTRLIVERAESGKVLRLIERREGEDLIWTRDEN